MLNLTFLAVSLKEKILKKIYFLSSTHLISNPVRYTKLLHIWLCLAIFGASFALIFLFYFIVLLNRQVQFEHSTKYLLLCFTGNSYNINLLFE